MAQKKNFYIAFFGFTHIRKLSDYFVLINVKNSYCSIVYFFEPSIDAAIGGNS